MASTTGSTGSDDVGGKVRLTIEVDEAWISQYVTFDTDGNVVFDTSVLEVVGIERI